MKYTTVFFDFEAPFLWKKDVKFDLESVIRSIRDVLNKFGVKAVFNTCGLLAEKFPKTVQELHDEGHEIASHGYAHENFLKTSTTDLDNALAKTERIIQGLIGEKPFGIRAPWLAIDERVYDVFRKRKYVWTSNSYLPFWATKARVELGDTSYTKWRIGKTVYELKRLFYKKEPFREDSLLEIPMLSPMDIFCIFPFPQVEVNSPENSLEEAYDIMISHYRKSKRHFNLTFHEHAIGTANRLQLLERVLAQLSVQSEVRFILPHEIDTLPF